MSDKGLRQSFTVPTETKSIPTNQAGSFGRHDERTTEVRSGKARTRKLGLRMPTDAEVKQWLNSVYRKFGYAKGLMAETVLVTAVRLEEVASWRVDTLPNDESLWQCANPEAPRNQRKVLVTLKYGTKGPDYGDNHGDKIGPEQSIWIPLDLAERLQDYRRNVRNRALRRRIKSAKTVPEQMRRTKDTVHLFLDERTGKRVTSKSLYHAWTGADVPFKGWSPHRGRDWWACSVLWRESKKHEALVALGLNAPAALLESTAISIVRLQVQPQLRHTDARTSMRYVDWFTHMLTAPLNILYDAEIDRKLSDDSPDGGGPR
jgi:hypothetical protein